MAISEEKVNEFRAAFCPYGYMDIQTAISHAEDAGHTIDWAVEQIEEFVESTGSPIDKIDPVYVVMDSILQEARTEIEEQTGTDIQNDLSIDTYGNFMCSSWECSEEDREELQSLIIDRIDSDVWSANTLYFLQQIDVITE